MRYFIHRWDLQKGSVGIHLNSSRTVKIEQDQRVVDQDEWRIWLPKYTDRLRLYAELLSDAILDAPAQLASRDEALRIARKREEDDDSRKKVRLIFGCMDSQSPIYVALTGAAEIQVRS